MAAKARQPPPRSPRPRTSVRPATVSPHPAVSVPAAAAPLHAYNERGERLVLAKRLGGGGEGDVYEVEGQPEWCAKVLHPGRRTEAKFDKVQAMVAAPPAGAY